VSTLPGYSFASGGKPLDESRIIDELRDQPELISRLLHLFVAETQKDFDGLTAAFAANDPSRIALIAHRLKGAAATMGAEPLRTEVAQIEDLARSGRLHQAQNRMSALHDEFDRLHDYIAEF
jgi:HPt (histidine-containing phosphotransfer) domain-containing protein